MMLKLKKKSFKLKVKNIFLICYRSAHKMENLFMLQLIAMALVLRASTSTAYPNSIGDYSGSSMCLLYMYLNIFDLIGSEETFLFRLN